MTLPDTPPAGDRLRIVVLGYLVRGPIGGMAWHHLQYAAGFLRLGHEVLFVEDSDDYPSCYDPRTHEVGVDPSYGLAFAQSALERLELGESWAYYDAHTAQWCGPAAPRAAAFCASADVVVNVSGVNPLRPWLADAPRRVLIDTDPVFTQVRNLTDAAFRTRTSQHNAFYSFGELIGSAGCTVPDDGVPWRPTRQPILLDAWPVTPARGDRYTTVMQWQSYPPVEHVGRAYGTKRESFELIEQLPSRVAPTLEIALGSADAPRQRLRDLGWRLRDPIAAAPDPWGYQAYLGGSRGELSIAKQAYASTQSGWFSERSACYLASGRPVVVQDTGFSRLLPTGEGLHAFDSIDSAAEAIARIESDYDRHRRDARDLAQRYFDSDAVLGGLLESLFATF